MNNHRQTYCKVRTRPWSQDEYLLVDGVRAVYNTNEHGTISEVHLPGGLSRSLRWLRAHCTVIMPIRLREAE